MGRFAEVSPQPQVGRKFHAAHTERNNRAHFGFICRTTEGSSTARLDGMRAIVGSHRIMNALCYAVISESLTTNSYDYVPGLLLYIKP